MMLLQILMITLVQMTRAASEEPKLYDTGARWQSQILQCDQVSDGGYGLHPNQSKKPVPGKWYPAYDETTSNTITKFLNCVTPSPISDLAKGRVGGNTTVRGYMYSYNAYMTIEANGRPFVIRMTHDGEPQQLSFHDHTFVRALRPDPELAAFRADARAFVNRFLVTIRRSVHVHWPRLWRVFCTNTGQSSDSVQVDEEDNPAKVQDFRKRAESLAERNIVTNVSGDGIPKDILLSSGFSHKQVQSL